MFGEGPAPAKLMIIGEQPGDKEDRAGHPFVGPAGALLDEVLDEAGIDRSTVFVTNAVKHFKWTRGNGKVRIHKSPSRSEVVACSQWWQRELEVVAPDVLVCLGAVAAKAVLGPSVKITECAAPSCSSWALRSSPPCTRPPSCAVPTGATRCGPISLPISPSPPS